MRVDASVLTTLTVIATVVGCSGERGASVEGPISERNTGESDDRVTTLDIRKALSADYERSTRELQLLQEHIDSVLRDTIVSSLAAVHRHWVVYREAQCEALKLVFEGGTLGPVAELDCLLDLTDGHHAFLRSQLDFILPREETGGEVSR